LQIFFRNDNQDFQYSFGNIFPKYFTITNEQKLDLTREDLVLPTSPYGPCAIHLTIFQDFDETLDMAESFLAINYLDHVWTVGKQTDRKISISIRPYSQE